MTQLHERIVTLLTVSLGRKLDGSSTTATPAAVGPVCRRSLTDSLSLSLSLSLSTGEFACLTNTSNIDTIETNYNHILEERFYIGRFGIASLHRTP
jgi:hypothetical protein